jgi:hypothetical protein
MKQLYRKDTGVKIQGTFDKVPGCSVVTEWGVGADGVIRPTVWNCTDVWWDDQYTEASATDPTDLWLVDENGEQVLMSACELRDDDENAENFCSECGAPTDDGEGEDGLCGSCADRRENDSAISDAMEALLNVPVVGEVYDQQHSDTQMKAYLRLKEIKGQS